MVTLDAKARLWPVRFTDQRVCSRTENGRSPFGIPGDYPCPVTQWFRSGQCCFRDLFGDGLRHGCNRQEAEKKPKIYKKQESHAFDYGRDLPLRVHDRVVEQFDPDEEEGAVYYAEKDRIVDPLVQVATERDTDRCQR